MPSCYLGFSAKTQSLKMSELVDFYSTTIDSVDKSLIVRPVLLRPDLKPQHSNLDGSKDCFTYSAI